MTGADTGGEGPRSPSPSVPTHESSKSPDPPGRRKAPKLKLSLTDFDIKRRLGDGSFCTVYHVMMKKNGKEYALKVMDKYQVVRHNQQKYVQNERNTLDALDNEGICRLHFTFQDDNSLYLGLDLLPNGELYDVIRSAGGEGVPEDHARRYAAEMILIHEYLRGMHIVHRDFKPENLLLNDEGHLVLVDFGSVKLLKPDLIEPKHAPAPPPPPARNSSVDDGDSAGSRRKKPAERATSFVGTADYVAPEVLSNTPVTCAADLWAIGAVVYQMLVGKPPFRGASEWLTFQNVTNAEFAIPPSLSQPAADLLRSLLKVDPEARLGAHDLNELKRHPFFEGTNWQFVRQQPAPPFEPPTRAPADAFDWELASLKDALPKE